MIKWNSCLNNSPGALRMKMVLQTASRSPLRRLQNTSPKPLHSLLFSTRQFASADCLESFLTSFFQTTIEISSSNGISNDYFETFPHLEITICDLKLSKQLMFFNSLEKQIVAWNLFFCPKADLAHWFSFLTHHLLDSLKYHAKLFVIFAFHLLYSFA